MAKVLDPLEDELDQAAAVLEEYAPSLLRARNLLRARANEIRAKRNPKKAKRQRKVYAGQKATKATEFPVSAAQYEELLEQATRS